MGVSIDSIVPTIFNSYGYIQPMDEEQKLNIQKKLNAAQQEVFNSMYDSPIEFQSIFRFWVNYAIFLKKEVVIRYYSDGSMQTLTEDDILKKQKKSLSFISISLNELVNQFLEQKSIEIIGNVEILSSNELEIIKYLRNNEITSISIFKDNGEPIKLVTKSFIQDMEINKRIYECLTSQYEKIEFVTNGGKTATFERTKNIKLN